MRRLTGGAIAAVLMVVFTSVVFNPAVAYAYIDETLEEQSSLVNGEAYKTVTATCPRGSVVVGVGGRTQRAGGRAVLIGVVPNPDLTEVTAHARALPGHTAPWGVTATAMCADPELYGPVRESGSGGSSAGAVCQKGKVLYSAGYLVGDGSAVAYVNSLIPSADGTNATVRAVGDAASLRVSVFAVCGNPPYYPEDYGRTQVTVPLKPGATTSGRVPPLWWYSWVFGAGAHTDQPGVFIDGFSPSAFYDTSTGLQAMARVARMDPLRPSSVKSSSLMAPADGDGDVTFYAESIGSWY